MTAQTRDLRLSGLIFAFLTSFLFSPTPSYACDSSAPVYDAAANSVQAHTGEAVLVTSQDMSESAEGTVATATGPFSVSFPKSVAADTAAADLPKFSLANVGHMFRNSANHLAEDTPANRALLRGAAEPGNRVGTYNGIDTYTQLRPDGRQVWVEVRNGEITNGGVNSTP